jgi:hypothetical protein
MPKKTKSAEDSLRDIQVLLAGLLLKEEPKPDVKKLAKLIGVDDTTISQLFPQRKGKKKDSSVGDSSA